MKEFRCFSKDKELINLKNEYALVHSGNRAPPKLVHLEK